MNKFISEKASALNMKRILTGITTTIVIAFTLSLVAPVFIKNEYYKQEYLWLIATIIHILSVFTGVLVSGMFSAVKQTITTVIIGGVWFLLMLCGGVILLDGENGHILSSLIGCVIGGSVASLLQFRIKKCGLPGKKGRRRGSLYKMTSG